MAKANHHPTKLERLARQMSEDLREHPELAKDPAIREKLERLKLLLEASLEA